MKVIIRYRTLSGFGKSDNEFCSKNYRNRAVRCKINHVRWIVGCIPSGKHWNSLRKLGYDWHFWVDYLFITKKRHYELLRFFHIITKDTRGAQDFRAFKKKDIRDPRDFLAFIKKKSRNSRAFSKKTLRPFVILAQSQKRPQAKDSRDSWPF